MAESAASNFKTRDAFYMSQRLILFLIVSFSFLQGNLFAQTPKTDSLTTAKKDNAALEKAVRAEIITFRGRVSLFAKNLDTGASFGIDETVPVRTASTIKVPIMVAAFAEVAAGKAQWTDPLTLTKEKKVSGAGILQELSDGLQVNLKDAVVLMITLSDNTATNLVLDHITADTVNAHLEKTGFTITRSMRKIGGGGESKAFNDPTNVRPDGTKYGIGRSSPREMVLLLEKLERGEIISPEASREMIGILKRQQYHDGIARSLKDIESATKPGALDALRSDVGIIYTKRGRIVMAITCDDMPQIDWTVDNPGHLLMSRIAQLLIEGLAK
jgi:beta-lactamase class A